MKILTVVGARPQFVKAGAVSKVIRKKAQEVLVHTGQHYDVNMSDVFFQELNIPSPDYYLGVGSGSHGSQTGKMLESIEKVILKESPDILLIYGDTNSTLAGALAAAKLHIPVGHVEAGLRSFNRKMPEEINRVVADHLSNWLFAPTETAVDNLKSEGLGDRVFLVGDVMYDIFLLSAQTAVSKSEILTKLALLPKKYLLLTMHRAENTDDPNRLLTILETLNQIDYQVIFPIHPRTKNKLQEIRADFKPKALQFIEPVGYFDMLKLELNAAIILTDSGGVQKEAYMAEVPCITLRDETEWVETVRVNWNKLVGANPDALHEAITLNWLGSSHPDLYGEGRAAEKITELLVQN